MQFQKGKEKTGGRKKGSQNRTTIEQREHLSRALGTCEETMEEDIKSLSPKDRLHFYLAMQNFVMPKMYAEKTDSEKSDEPVKIEVTREIVYRALSEEEIESGSWKND